MIIGHRLCRLALILCLNGASTSSVWSDGDLNATSSSPKNDSITTSEFPPSNSSSYNTSIILTTSRSSLPVCDQTLYGPLNALACQEALDSIWAVGAARTTFEWADRGHYSRNHIQIPRRFSSCTLTPAFWLRQIFAHQWQWMGPVS